VPVNYFEPQARKCGYPRNRAFCGPFFGWEWIKSSLEKGRGRYSKYAPYAFTEHGVVMLSSVLRSKRAVQMNILIVRAFVKLREMLASHKELSRAIEDIGRKLDEHGEQIVAIVETINQLLAPESVEPTRRIGFHAGDDYESG
jgi:phage regulator Rha-like protein